MNVLEIQCLKRMVGMTLTDEVRDEEVRRKAGMERVLASRVDQ